MTLAQSIAASVRHADLLRRFQSEVHFADLRAEVERRRLTFSPIFKTHHEYVIGYSLKKVLIAGRKCAFFRAQPSQYQRGKYRWSLRLLRSLIEEVDFVIVQAENNSRKFFFVIHTDVLKDVSLWSKTCDLRIPLTPPAKLRGRQPYVDWWQTLNEWNQFKHTPPS